MIRKILSRYYYKLKIFILNTRENLYYYYERHLAVIIAKYFFLIPILEYIFEKKKIIFIRTVPMGPGELIPAIDGFIRKLHLGILKKDKKYIWISKNRDTYNILMKNTKEYFYFSSHNTFLYYLFLPIMIRRNNVTLECGIARTKWIIPKNGKVIKKTIGRNNYLDRYSRSYSEKAWLDYWKIKNNKMSGNGLSKDYPISYSLKNLINKNINKIALIHAKFIKRNSAAKATDPNTYLPTLYKIKQNGYYVIYVGREKMPDEFKKLNIFDYANSKHANFQNDLGLFSLAKISIIGGSGIAALPVICKTPFLYINAWDSFIWPWSYNLSVFIPTLMKDKNNNKLTIKQQLEVLRYRSEEGPENFPEQDYDPIDANDEQILEAYYELEDLIKNNNKEWTGNQKLIKNLDFGHLSFLESRISDKFINQNLEILN